MKRTAIALALLLPATAVLASDDAPVSAELEAQVAAILTAEGYELISLEMEDSGYEAEATRDGTEFEIALDENLAILSVEEDD